MGSSGDKVPQLPVLRQFPDYPEPLVHDLALAVRLGYGSPRKIRELIRRNRSKLSQLGPRPVRGAGPYVRRGGDGQFTENPESDYGFWLNKEQVAWICSRSRTLEGDRIRDELTALFLAWQGGGAPMRCLPTVPPLLTFDSRGKVQEIESRVYEKLVFKRSKMNPSIFYPASSGVAMEILSEKEAIAFADGSRPLLINTLTCKPPPSSSLPLLPGPQ